MSKLKTMDIIEQKPERQHRVLTEEKLDEIELCLSELSLNCT
jgi:hypothetical protein